MPPNEKPNDKQTNQKQDTSIPSLREKFRAKFTQANQQPSQAYTDKPVSLGLVNELNDHELMTLSSRHYVPDPRPVQDERYLPVLETMERSSLETISNIADAERLKALDPNIKRVEAIVVSSIMSPNDMQDVDPEIIVDCDEISEDKRNEIAKILQHFYCDIYGLRARMTRWIKEAHFRSGAGVTIILPEATLTSLINTYDPDRQLLKLSGTDTSYGQEALSPTQIAHLQDVVASDEFYAKVCESKPYHMGAEGFVSYTRRSTDSKGIKINSGKEPEETKVVSTDWFNMDSFIKMFMESDDIPQQVRRDQKVLDTYKTGVESIALNFVKALTPGADQTKQNFVKIIDDPEALRVGKLVQNRKKKRFQDICEKSVLGELMKAYQSDDQTENLYYQSIPLMDLTGMMTDYKVQKSFPIIMDVPTEAFIPICTPGDKTRIIGGFLLTDAYGQFVEASGYVANGESQSSNRLSIAYNAMYGSEPTESGIRTSSGLGMTIGVYPSTCGCNKANLIKIFNYVLDEMLRKHLEDVGLSDVTLGRYNAIAQCMLHRLLDKKQTRLIFVPEKYITYMTFDQHFDGTGKSRIEDILYMESLKISFLTASTLAAMKNAVPVKKVKLNLDPKQKNMLGTVMMLRNAIIQRERFSPSTWPATVSSQLQAQNLSIEAGHPNSEGFSWTVEDSHREIPKADTEFLDKIDDATITGLGVMPSALQESSDVQFARSLATTNLYYAKSIRQDQLILEAHTDAHIQRHLSLSSVLIYEIARILKDTPAMTDKTPSSNNDGEKLEKLKPTIDDGSTTVSRAANKIDKETFAKVLQVIDNVHVKLAPPDVAPNNAHYEILTEVIKRIREYVDAVYPEELSGFGGDTDVSNAYKLFKGQIYAKMTRDAANSLGFSGLLCDVPAMEDFVVQNRDKLSTMFSILNGIQADITRTQQAMSKKQDQNADNGEDSGGGGNSWL